MKQALGASASRAGDLTTKTYTDLMDDAHGGPGPTAHGALAWTCDPAMTANASHPATGTTAYFRWRAQSSGTVLNLKFGVTTAGATITAALMGIYDISGVKLGETGSLAAVVNSTGMKSAALTAGVVITAGTEYVLAVLMQATTLPAFTGTIGSTYPNLGMTVGTSQPLRSARTTTTGTTLATPINWTTTVTTAVGNMPCVLFTV